MGGLQFVYYFKQHKDKAINSTYHLTALTDGKGGLLKGVVSAVDYGVAVKKN
jgi:hypothetical protein